MESDQQIRSTEFSLGIAGKTTEILLGFFILMHKGIFTVSLDLGLGLEE